MISEIFLKNRAQKPLILDNCTLFIKLEHYDINTTYIYKKQGSYKVEECGQLWVQDYIRTEISYIGYFTCPPYSDFVFGDAFSGVDSEDVVIIGYSKGIRYYVDGISITKDKFGFGVGYATKFSCMDLKILKKNSSL